jgi:hypothetical protein
MISVESMADASGSCRISNWEAQLRKNYCGSIDRQDRGPHDASLGGESMRLQSGLFALAIVLFASTAHAGWAYGIKGNDTGGIIPWSPWVKYTYRTIAADFCAQYYKVAHITSVHPWYGDFVGFTCAFPRHYDPVKTWYLSPN